MVLESAVCRACRACLCFVIRQKSNTEAFLKVRFWKVYGSLELVFYSKCSEDFLRTDGVQVVLETY